MNLSNVESGFQLFSRVNHKTFLEGINPNFFPDGGPLPNQVIEIIGDVKLDKNDVLIDFIVKCILPNNYHSEWKSSGAVLILCQHQINLLKIIKVIETHLKNNNVEDPKKEILQDSLKNLTVFDCYSLEELEITLMSLERLILARENINLVVIDNISSYYWIAKQDLQSLSYYQHALNVFQKIFAAIKTLNVILIYVRSDKRENSDKKCYQNLNYRITLREEIDRVIIGTVTDFLKQTITPVKFKHNVALEFV